MSIETVRELARRYTAEQIDRCLQEEIEVGHNACTRDDPREAVVRELAEAEFVREQVERGIPLGDALRDLARRIRAVQRGFTQDP